MIDRSDRDGVAILRLAHGKASALDIELLEEIRRQLASIAASHTRAVVITGTASIFSAGVDLFRMLNEGEPYVRRFFPAMIDAFGDLFLFPRPVIAAINGHAIAGGAIMAAACDYRIMAGGKGRMGIPELLVGVPFPAFALEIVRFGVPPQLVEEMVYTGRSFAPPEALQRGLVQEVVEPGALLDRAVAVASDIGGRPPEAFRMTKRQLREPFARRGREMAAADGQALEIWSSSASHAHIREYLSQTVGKK